MVESTSGSDLLNALAYEFCERHRRGERPSLSEYTNRYPGLAGDIQELFPTLVVMKHCRSGVVKRTVQGTSRTTSQVPIPERLGDYRILREIGRGGMGIVYEAVQESLGRHVALKVLTHNRHLGSVHLMRFQREAKAAALLHHTNIVPVFGVGEHEGVHYYAMQYIQGQSLDAVLHEVVRMRRKADPTRIVFEDESDSISGTLASGRMTQRVSGLHRPTLARDTVPVPKPGPGESRNKLSPRATAEGSPAGAISSASPIQGNTEAPYFRSVARMGVQAAEALGHAHLHGVLHRDIKPGNLLLDLQGTIWVTDFGLAKAEGTDELTSPGDVVGTLRYLAPERFQGKADASSDVYSLGLTLYEMVTLKPAFGASHRVQLMNAILHDEPARPRKLDPRIPIDLETIILKASAKSPSDRFPSALAMAAELKRYLEGRPIRSRRVSLPERIWRWSQRNRAVAMLLLLATSLTAMLLVGSVVAAWTFREQRNAVQVQERKTRENLDLALKAERKRRAELGRAALVQARATRYSGQPGRRFEALETLTKAAEIARESDAPKEHLAELRDEVIAALALAGDRPLKSWSGPPREDALTAYCVAADRYVTVEGKGILRVRRLSDRSDVRVLGLGRPADRVWPVFVPGGRFIRIWAGTVENELWDIERGELRTELPEEARCVVSRADGRQVAALLPDGELRVYDLPDMTVRSRCRLGVLVPARLRYQWMSLSEDGRRLALLLPDESSATVYDVASGRVVLEMEPPSARVDTAISLNRNGVLLAIPHDRSISVYDVADGERLALLQGHQSEGIVASFQPGGGLLASSGWDGTTRLWDPIRGRQLVALKGGFREWTDGGSSVTMYLEKTLVVHEVAANFVRRTIDYRTLGDHAGEALFGPARVAYSPDGQLIAIAVRPDGVRIARATDGVGLAYLPIGYCDEVLFLPGGALLTFNERGLCRWPVRRISDRVLRMGPADPLALIDQSAGIVLRGLAASASGRLVGVGSPYPPGALLLDPDQPRRRMWLTPNVGMPDVAISPDGRWAAASEYEAYAENAVGVWDTATARLVARLPVGNARVAFSPDGRWLGLGGVGCYRFFRTGSWKPGAQIESGAPRSLPIAFHPDSQIAAILDGNQARVRLIDIETGSMLAALDGPDQSMTNYVVFSPDGRHLAAAQSDQRVDIWDLSAVRRRLLELDLAAGLPDIFGGNTTSGVGPHVEQIEVEGADPAGLRLLAVRQLLRRAWFALRSMVDPSLSDAEERLARGIRWERLGQWRLAAADFRASLALHPNSNTAAYLLARCLTFEPGRDPTREAIRSARTATLLHPDNVRYRNILGAAYYRAGEYAEASALLEPNTPQDTVRAGYHWLFLAMCRQRLGQTSGARTALAEATRWRAERIGLPTGPTAEFYTLLREAQSVVDGALPELPANVFER
jgi:serine/threonine protein kinase/WD40 repeat protein